MTTMSPRAMTTMMMRMMIIMMTIIVQKMIILLILITHTNIIIIIIIIIIVVKDPRALPVPLPVVHPTTPSTPSLLLFPPTPCPPRALPALLPQSRPRSCCSRASRTARATFKRQRCSARLSSPSPLVRPRPRPRLVLLRQARRHV